MVDEDQELLNSLSNTAYHVLKMVSSMPVWGTLTDGPDAKQLFAEGLVDENRNFTDKGVKILRTFQRIRIKEK